MTDSSVMHSDGVSPITDLVAELRETGVPGGELYELAQNAANTIEAQAKEIETLREGAFHTYKALGEDTDGARDADALFDPMKQLGRLGVGGYIARLTAAYREDMEGDWDRENARAEKAEQERDAAVAEMHARELHHFEEEQKSAAAHAVIAEAWEVTRSASVPLGLSVAQYYDRLIVEIRRILSAVPTSVIREHDERVKAEAGEKADRLDSLVRWVDHTLTLPIYQNPRKGSEAETVAAEYRHWRRLLTNGLHPDALAWIALEGETP